MKKQIKLTDKTFMILLIIETAIIVVVWVVAFYKLMK